MTTMTTISMATRMIMVTMMATMRKLEVVHKQFGSFMRKLDVVHKEVGGFTQGRWRLYTRMVEVVHKGVGGCIQGSTKNLRVEKIEIKGETYGLSSFAFKALNSRALNVSCNVCFSLTYFSGSRNKLASTRSIIL